MRWLSHLLPTVQATKFCSLWIDASPLLGTVAGSLPQGHSRTDPPATPLQIPQRTHPTMGDLGLLDRMKFPGPAHHGRTERNLRRARRREELCLILDTRGRTASSTDAPLVKHGPNGRRFRHSLTLGRATK